MRKQKKTQKQPARAKSESRAKKHKAYTAPKLTVHGKLERLAAGSGQPYSE